MVAAADPRGGGDAQRTSYLERMCAERDTTAVEKREKGTFGAP